MTAKIIIQNMELTVSSRLKNIGVKFPNTEKTDRTLHNEFAMTLHANTKKHSFNYYDSHRAFEEGKIELTDNDMLYAARSIFDDAASGNENGLAQGLSTLGGLLPPPFGTLLSLGGMLGFGIWKQVQASRAAADAQAALDAQAQVANHAATPGVSATDVAQHVATVTNGLSEGAAKLYNNAPTINIPQVTSPTTTIGV